MGGLRLPIRSRLAAFATIAAAVVSMWLAAAPAEAIAAPKAALILFEGIGYDELIESDLPPLRSLREKGAVGLMLGPTEYEPANITSYVSIGLGRPVRSQVDSPLGVAAYDVDEDIRRGSGQEAYGRTVGADTAGFAVLSTEVVGLRTRLAAGGSGARVGTLADALAKAGVTTRAVGGSDRRTGAVVLDRPVALIAMDSEGRVPKGRVSDLNGRDIDFPFGTRTDYGAVLEEVRSTGSDEVVVIDTGDSRRANLEAQHATDRAASGQRSMSLEAAEPLLALADEWVDDGTLVFIVSVSTPMTDLERGRTLTPLIAAGGDIAAGGVLTSTTTRQSGLVAPWDIAPTIARYAQASQDGFVGNAIQAESEKPLAEAIEDLDLLAENAALVRQARPAVLAGFSAVQMLAIIALAVPFVHSHFTGRRRGWWLLLVLLSMPLALFVQALAGPLSAAPALAVAAALAVVMVLAGSRAPDIRWAFIALATLATFVLLLDLAFGAPVMRWSYLGYDMSAGGRFYGIGNEYAGVLLGSSLLAATLVSVMFARSKRVLAIVSAVFASIVVMLALPQFGADAGGALASMVAYGVVLWGLSGRRLSGGRIALLLLVLGAGALAALIAVNAFGAGAPSHVGRFFGDALSGGAASAAAVIRRKVNANVVLFTYTQWGRLLWAYIALFAWLWHRRNADIRRAWASHRSLRIGLLGVAVGALALFALNDSGTVALVLLAPYALALVLVVTAIGQGTFSEEAAATTEGRRA